MNHVEQPSHKLPEASEARPQISFKTLTLTSLIAGFFLIPFHEFGHVVCDWITGHPAAMSYARDYLLAGGETPFLGLLGGPIFPLILSTTCIILIHRGVRLSVTYPLAVLGTMDRLLLYLSGVTPSDERDLARTMVWPPATFKYIFLGAEILLLVLVLSALIRHKVGLKRSVLVFVIPLASFVISASFGVLVVDRFVFPEQHKKEFGLIPPTGVIDSFRPVGCAGLTWSAPLLDLRPQNLDAERNASRPRLPS